MIPAALQSLHTTAKYLCRLQTFKKPTQLPENLQQPTVAWVPHSTLYKKQPAPAPTSQEAGIPLTHLGVADVERKRLVGHKVREIGGLQEPVSHLPPGHHPTHKLYQKLPPPIRTDPDALGISTKRKCSQPLVIIAGAGRAGV